jgi:hypothetical protein
MRGWQQGRFAAIGVLDLCLLGSGETVCFGKEDRRRWLIQRERWTATG